MAMTARTPPRWWLLASLVVLACDAPTGSPPASIDAPPNVLLVSIDTLRADHVGAFGADHAATPQLDAIAAEGARFTQAISPAPLTLPSHATLLTGLDPPRHGVRHNGIHRLPGAVTTLAERFQQAGYATAAVVGAAVLSARQGLGQGFDHYDDAIVPRDGRLGGAAAQRDAGAVSEAARAWLRDAPEPFFLFLHFYDPHASYQPPPPFDGFAHPYDGEIAYVDAQLGTVLAQLRAAGQLDETLVAVTADHGESLGEHGEATHAYTVYDATQRVPLLLRGPGIQPGLRVDSLVRLADVAPTLLARAGLPPLAPEAELDGRDLGPLLAGRAAPEREAYVETLATRIDQGWAPLHGMRSGQALLIRAPRPELYLLAADPGQLENVYGKPGHGPLREGLESSLEDRLRTPAASLEETPLDAGTRAQLEALGYALPEASDPSAASGPTDGATATAAEEPLIDPKDGLIQHRAYHEAELALAAGRLDEAREGLLRLVAAHPRSAPAFGKLAVVALRQGDGEAARRHARRAAELQPQSSPYWQQLGVIQRETAFPDAARQSFEVAIRLDPGNGVAHLEQMETCALLADRDCMESAHGRARGILGHNVVALRRMADAWETAGHAQEALAAYQRVLELAPESPRDHMHAAIHAAALGDRALSESHLARAGTVRNDPRAQRMLAEARAAAAQQR